MNKFNLLWLICMWNKRKSYWVKLDIVSYYSKCQRHIKCKYYKTIECWQSDGNVFFTERPLGEDLGLCYTGIAT